ncbi:MAG: hypothetical protein CML46_13650 [Rhodobacteraceae bacterium]|nr:hypothetical protein [Paracoccaceae bacterium]MBR27973.1 hypothetical protein [Paracoccaceae bacterium]
MKAVRIALRALPAPLAIRLLLRVSGRVPPLAVSEEAKAAFSEATKTGFGPGARIPAWVWGDGPAVLLVHGYGGRAAQMAPLARNLAAQGYRCVAPDITGHGDTPGRVRWSWFLRDIADVAAELGGPLHGAIGHSAGGLTMMEARRSGALAAERFVCVCAPSHPFPPVRRVKAVLDPPERIVDRYRDYLASEFATTWPELEAGRAFSGAESELLLVYEERDRFIPISEAHLLKTVCPEASLVITNGYGHERILGAPELEQAICRHLA